MVGLSVARLLAGAVLVLVGSACGDGPTPPPVGAVSLTLLPVNDIRLDVVGQTADVTATPKDASGNTVSATVTWTSSNEAVATVASTGATTATVTARAQGSATIRAAVSASIFEEIDVFVQQPRFNVNAGSGLANACEIPDLRTYRIETQTPHLIIVSDVANPAGGFTTQDYESIAAEFESLVWPVVTSNFGIPFDMDGNGKIIAFYTRAVNELTPANSQSVVGGFFFGRDLFPKVASGGLGACPTSNEAEMFYMLVPDPNGVVNGNTRAVADVRRITVGVLAHEFQHLINSSRRLYVNQAADWPEVQFMEEGLSHIAEELVFYEASGMAPRANINVDEIRASPQRLAALNSYMASNAGRLSRYLQAPSVHAPYDRDDDLETRGAIWSFLRYLADRAAPGTPLAETACTSTPLTVGQQCAVQGAAAASFTVPAGASAGEFTVVSFARDASFTTTASGTNTITAIGPPNPSAGSGGGWLSASGQAGFGAFIPALKLDDAFHAELRATERRHLPRLVDGARAAYALRSRPSASMHSAGQTTPSMSHIAVEPVWSQLVNSNDTGIVNLRGRFGQDISGAAQDWAMANYVDDVGLPGVPTQHTHPSWNFRSLIAALSSNSDQYPLQAHQLTTTARQQLMVNGGAAYYRFGLAAGASSTVTFTVNGGAPPAGLQLVVVRTK